MAQNDYKLTVTTSDNNTQTYNFSIPQGPQGYVGNGGKGIYIIDFVGETLPEGEMFGLSDGDLIIQKATGRCYIALTTEDSPDIAYLTTIKGTQGLKGPKGDQGPKGIPGDKGATGNPGVTVTSIDVIAK